MKQGQAQRPIECFWVPVSGDSTVSATFQVADTAPGMQKASFGQGEPVSGLGDEATFYPVGNLLVATKGQKLYIGGVYMGGKEARAQSLDLAREVLPKLP